MTLYIYRVGWTYPARNPYYRSRSTKNPYLTRTPPRPVRPVGPCQTGHNASTGQTARSDRSDRWCQFWLSTVIPFLNLCHPKGTSKRHVPLFLVPTIADQDILGSFENFSLRGTSPSQVSVQNLVFSPFPMEKMPQNRIYP